MTATTRQHAARGGASFARSAGAAAGRGVLLIAAAVGVGVLLLSQSDGERVRTAAAPPADEAPPATVIDAGPAAAPPAAVTTPPASSGPALRNPAEYKVLVVNAAKVSGLAKANTNALSSKGYVPLEPVNAKAVAASNVFFRDGYQAEALEVARLLGIKEQSVAGLPAVAPVDAKELADASVVVLLGQDGQGIRPS